MAYNMTARIVADASDFESKMKKVGVTAERTSKRIKKSMSMSDISSEAAKIMGWSGEAIGIGNINSGNFSQAQSQLGILKSYRDQLAGAGFDDYQFGLVSERIKALEYDLNEYVQSLERAADAEREAAGEADHLGDEAQRTTVPVEKSSRSLRDLFNSGRRLNLIPGFIRRIGDSAGGSNVSLERMVRTIRNVSVVSFGLRIVRGLFGELGTIVRNYISTDAQLQAQVNGLSSSLGNILAPAIHLVTNALSYVLPYVVGVSNAIGQLMGALFGTGWSAGASGANKMAAATGGAAKAQKEMNKQLLSFDQINRMESQKDSGSGGGGGGAGSALEQIVGKTPAWMERFKQSFTDLFNSSEFQAANIGGKIGMALQTALDWLGGEGARWDWRGAGMKLVENLQSFMETDATESFYRTLAVFFAGAVDFSFGALFASMSPALKDLLTAWKNEGIQGVILYIEGMKLALINNIVPNVLSKYLIPIFQGFADYFREHGSLSVAGFFEGCANAMSNAVETLRRIFVDPIVNGTKELLGIHSPSTVFASIGEDCMSGLTNGFTNGVAWVQEKLDALRDRVSQTATSLKEAFSFEWRLPHLRLPHLQVDWDPVDNVLANFFGVTAFPRLSVHWFAKGGILNGAQIFGRMGSTLLGGGERGREAILPLDTNTGWMDVLARRIAQSLDVGSGSGGDVTVNVVLDGELITSYVMKRMRGKSRAGTASI